MLAIDPSRLLESSSPRAFFWLFGGGSPMNERRGDVALVHVRGALDHHADSWGENYESILQRVESAMTGQDTVEAHERAHRWDEDFQPIEAEKPAAVVMCIDSPGGVVSGLNETVRKLKLLSKTHGVRLVAYVNEMAASAAYALCCACDEVIAPPSAIIGSIGVISTMASVAARNKAEGIDVRLITSGARKADGHVHAPITDAAVEAERGRVEKLAADFFRIASEARNLSVDAIRKLEAGIYLGRDARKRRLIDAVMGLDEAVAALSKAAPTPEPEEAGGNETDRRANFPLDSTTHTKSRSDSSRRGTTRATHEANMPVQLDALIQKTQAALAAETNPKRRAELAADLARQMKTAAECDPDDDDDGEEDEDEKKSKKASAAKKMEEAAEEEEEKKAAKSKKGGESEEEEEEEEESAKAIAALVYKQTGMRGSAALGALAATFSRLESVEADTAALKAKAAEDEKSSLIAKAVKYVPKSQIKWLETQSLKVVRGFVEQACKGAPMVVTAEGELLVPKAVTPGTEEALPKDMLAQIEAGMNACPPGYDKAKFRASLVASMLEQVAKNPNLNGSSQRY